MAILGSCLIQGS